MEFINQLAVEDDERAATLVAVSNKWAYARKECTSPTYLPFSGTTHYPLQAHCSSTLSSASTRASLPVR